MTPEEVAALTNEALIGEIIEWADTVQDAILACRNWANYPKALAVHSLRLKNAEQTLALLRAEILRRMAGDYPLKGVVRHRYQRMLYEMTSLTDWMRAGYSSEEYAALVAQFEGADAPGGE